MPYSVEIVGSTVILKDGTDTLRSLPLDETMAHLAHVGECTFSDDPIPDGVRFVRRRGDATLVVLEIPPQYRTVRWLDDSSPVPYGPMATYQTVRLAFPYMVLFILFMGGNMIGYQQLYYRTKPISSIDDDLLLPNIRNCHQFEDLECILCLGHRDVGSVTLLPWHEKINRVIELFWFRGFNKSPEASRRVSYWTLMQKLDPRISSIEAWVKASAEDRFFPLVVKWKPASSNIREVIDDMLDAQSGQIEINDADGLVDFLFTCESLPL